ncbi:PspC domain-containing protein [Brevibacillus marinus]|jgi:phage shock protein PspC (stress-responsive transcriptional regulator)|uniref:PspC domain-containing protein n=1 Tax=Brevibacillus marinus TaxID=2496837 RepID=UPI000F82FEAD|nr:PspC domain-containing protein [Brevibacillus marinus]
MKTLYRSRHDKKLFGLCGGLGEYFGLDPTWIRLGLVVLTLFTGLPILFYLAGALIVPKEPLGFAGTDPWRDEWGRAASDSLDQEIDRLEKRALQKEVYRLRRELTKYQTQKTPN